MSVIPSLFTKIIREEEEICTTEGKVLRRRTRLGRKLKCNKVYVYYSWWTVLYICHLNELLLRITLHIVFYFDFIFTVLDEITIQAVKAAALAVGSLSDTGSYTTPYPFLFTVIKESDCKSLWCLKSIHLNVI